MHELRRAAGTFQCFEYESPAASRHAPKQEQHPPPHSMGSGLATVYFGIGMNYTPRGPRAGAGRRWTTWSLVTPRRIRCNILSTSARLTCSCMEPHDGTPRPPTRPGTHPPTQAPTHPVWPLWRPPPRAGVRRRWPAPPPRRRPTCRAPGRARAGACRRAPAAAAWSCSRQSPGLWVCGDEVVWRVEGRLRWCGVRKAGGGALRSCGMLACGPVGRRAPSSALFRTCGM